MLMILYDAADSIAVDAYARLCELSAEGWLVDVILVPVEAATDLNDPKAVLLSNGEEVCIRLWDALATAAPREKLVTVAIASGVLDSGRQRRFADAVKWILAKAVRLHGSAVEEIRLFLPEWASPGINLLAGIDPSYFSPGSSNLVALPTDFLWRHGMPKDLTFADADRFATHAALEVATVARLWRSQGGAGVDLRAVKTGVLDMAVRIIRSSTRTIAVATGAPRGEQSSGLPVADGCLPATDPERLRQGLSRLLPEDFRLESHLTDHEKAGGEGVWAAVKLALRRLFPLLASGPRAILRSFAREFEGDLAEDDDRLATEKPPDPPLASAGTPRPLPVVLRGFQERAWSDLVRNVLGMVDGAGTDDAEKARRAAGHEDQVFTQEHMLLDDALDRILCEELSDMPPSSADARRANSDASEQGDSEATNDSPADRSAPSEAVAPGDSEFGDELSTGADVDANSGSEFGSEKDSSNAYTNEGGVDAENGSEFANEVASGGEAASAFDEDDPSGRTEAPRGLLSLVVDRFDCEIKRAEQDRERCRERKRKAARKGEEIEAIKPPAAATRATIIGSLVMAFFLVAGLVLVRDALDFGELGAPLRMRIVLAVTAFVWLVLLIPLAPLNRADPRVTHSYLIRRAVVVSVLTALVCVLAGEFAEHVSEWPWMELFALGLAAMTGFLLARVRSSEQSRQRETWRALALAFGVVYLVVGLLVYANMGQSRFNQWRVLRDFFARRGDELRGAAFAVVIFLVALALVIVAASLSRQVVRQRRIEARKRFLERRLKGLDEAIPLLEALRYNWLGTAAALQCLLRGEFGRHRGGEDDPAGHRDRLLRFRVKTRTVEPFPLGRGWLYSRYRDAGRHYGEASGNTEPPETSTQVSSPSCELLTEPSADRRWDFARWLCKFRRRRGNGSSGGAIPVPEGPPPFKPGPDDLDFLNELIGDEENPKLPVQQLGPCGAFLGEVPLSSEWWWPEGVPRPEVLGHANPASGVHLASVVHHGEERLYQAIRLEISETRLLGDLGGGRPQTPEPDVAEQGKAEAAPSGDPSGVGDPEPGNDRVSDVL